MSSHITAIFRHSPHHNYYYSAA